MRDDGRPLTLLGMAWRNLFRQRVRTSLTVLGVGIGVVAVVAFSSIVSGLWEAAAQGMRFADTDLHIFQAGVSIDVYSRLDEKETRELLLADPAIAECSGVLAHVLPMEGMPFVLMIGLEPAGFTIRAAPEPEEGRHIQADDEVAIGLIAQRNMKKNVGDTIRVHGREYRIVGVYRTGVVYYDAAVIMRLAPMQELLRRPNDVTTFQVHLQEGADLRATIKRLETKHPQLVAISDVTEYTRVDRGLQVGDAMVRGVTFLSLVVGCIVVANTMWMSVHERTREIGVLRAVGLSSRSVIALILLEALGVAGLATVVGFAAGVGLAKLTAAIPVFAAFTDPVFTPTLFLRAACMAVVLSLLGGAWPAWRASRITPAEALRYE
jgi:putative ABC transport system permease protein